MYSTTDFRKGLKVEIGGEPFVIVDFQHVKPGKGGAFVRTRLKSLVSGNVIDQTFRSGDRVDKPDLEEREMQFLYEAGGEFHFMETQTFEQLFLTADQPWEGKVIFDRPRHKEFMRLPLDYARINQFPEWFVAEAERKYVIRKAGTGEQKTYSGKELGEGIPLALKAGEEARWVVKEGDF